MKARDDDIRKQPETCSRHLIVSQTQSADRLVTFLLQSLQPFLKKQQELRQSNGKEWNAKGYQMQQQNDSQRTCIMY